MPVTIPASGTGTATPIIATDNVTADSSQVQIVEIAGVSGGVLSRVTVIAAGDGDGGGGALRTESELMVYDSSSASWNRARAASYSSDAQNPGTGSAILETVARGTVYNGTSNDRQRSIAGVTAGANTDLGILAAGVGPGYARIPAAQTPGATGAQTAISCKGAGTLILDVAGTFTATLSFEATVDDSTWFSVVGYRSDGSQNTGTSNAGRFVFPASLYRQIRINVTAYTSGTPTINWAAQAASAFAMVIGPNAQAAGVLSGHNDAASLNGTLQTTAADYIWNGSTFDRARSITALDAAPNVDTGIQAIGVGPGWDRKRTASAMAVTLNTATTLVVDGAASMMFQLKFNTVAVGTGTLIFEVTADDTNWVTAPTVMKMPDQTAVGGTFAPATNTQYMVSVAGWRQVRVRVAAALTSGTIDVLTTGSHADALITLADRQRVLSYGAVFRLAETTTSLALSFTHVANTTKQYATIHHAATALKLAKIRKVTFWLYSTSAVLDGVLELRRITAAPATGAPAITPAAHDPGNAAAEATCLALPGTAGTEAAVNSPVASIGLNLGITTANVNQTGPIRFDLFDADKYTDMQALNIRPLTLEGWAIDLRTVGITTVKATIEVQFTEE